MTQAIFLSYASQDANAARRICAALRATGLEVWFDQNELTGGDAWDQKIRKQIKECSLFVPIISANTDARPEGYFRLEWKLAVDRSHLMADSHTFFFPVILGDVSEPAALVPDKFRERQWSRLSDDVSIQGFAARVSELTSGGASSGKNISNGPSNNEVVVLGTTPKTVAPLQNGAQPQSGELTNLDPDPRRDDSFKSGAEGGQPIQSTSGVCATITQHKRRNPFLLAAGAALTLAIGAAAYFYFPRAGNEPITSIAVLPFQIKGNEADADYLGDGLAESLIHRLSQLPKLKVSPTSSAFRFKGNDVDPIKAGNDLNVRAVMIGRILQRGDNFSISVELIDVRNKASLWGEKYERKQSELLATQREMATEITRKLHLKLTGDDAKLLAKRYTDNNNAYQLYLQGRYQYAKRGKDNLARAITSFEQAIAIDNNFALAYVGLADTYSIDVFNGKRTVEEALPLARAAATRALQIDANVADAHAAMASIAAMNWQWDEAERGFRRALELNPDVAEIRFRHALYWLLPQGRTDEAIAEFKRALELDPLSLVTTAVMARAYIQAGQTARAVEQAKKAYALDPTAPTGQSWLRTALVADGKYDEALALLEIASDSDFVRFERAMVHAKTGRRDAAMRELATIEAQPGTLPPSRIAAVHALLGNRDAAFTYLERAVVAREFQVAFLKVNNDFASLRSDPRYDALLKRIGLAK